MKQVPPPLLPSSVFLFVCFLSSRCALSLRLFLTLSFHPPPCGIRSLTLLGHLHGPCLPHRASPQRSLGQRAFSPLFTSSLRFRLASVVGRSVRFGVPLLPVLAAPSCALPLHRFVVAVVSPFFPLLLPGPTAPTRCSCLRARPSSRVRRGGIFMLPCWRGRVPARAFSS